MQLSLKVALWAGNTALMFYQWSHNLNAKLCIIFKKKIRNDSQQAGKSLKVFSIESDVFSLPMFFNAKNIIPTFPERNTKGFFP